MGTPGVCKTLLGSSLAFKARKPVAEKEGKEAECLDKGSGCWATPEAKPRFLGWPGGLRMGAAEIQNFPTPLKSEFHGVYLFI